MPDLSSTLKVLTAMITPAVMMLVCGSLTLGTSQRLNRVIERTRRMSEMHRKAKKEDMQGMDMEEQIVIQNLLAKQTRRVILLQQALASFYISLCLFVLTSVAIGVVELVAPRYPIIPMTVGIAAAAPLFYGTVLLLFETRIALKAIHGEMEFIAKMLDRV